jgi:anti-anti-sigma factor
VYEPVPTELKVLQPRPRMAVVEALGEHDLSTEAEAAAVFARLLAENDLLVIDITETQFIDSSFLNNLAKAQRAAQELGHTVLLQVGTEPIVKRMLEITNFLTHFDHVSSREEALAWAPAQ